MSNAGQQGKPHNSAHGSGEDIPAALRDTPDAAPQRGLRVIFLIAAGILGFVLIAGLSGFIFSLTASRQAKEGEAKSSQINPDQTPADNTNNTTQALLGHLPYPEAPQSDLVPIPGHPRLRLHRAAAEKFHLMVQDARRSGVNIVPISAFRSEQEQKQLFFGVGAQRNQTPAQRAALSAPPGYSEHHTGYAVDIGDGNAPATNLSENFEKTKAFVWMSQNAAKYGFELSFPRDNQQGVSYEPWHWRFVGDRDSLETFYKARNIKPKQP